MPRKILYPFLFISILAFLAGGSERRSADEPDAEPSDWAYRQRTFPGGKWNPNAYEEAYRQREQLEALPKRYGVLRTWEAVGPTNVGGRISDVEFDPQNPETIYAASGTGGVFKSEDNGETWRPIFDGNPVLSVGDIGISDSNPDVVFVGTGEANAGAFNLQGDGIYKSNDGGETWSYSGLRNTAAIGRIVVHPTNPDIVYVAAVGSYFDLSPDRGVFRSTDGGATWERVLAISDSTGAVDLVMNHEDPSVLYASVWQRLRRPDFGIVQGPQSGVYRTRDGGDTWEELGPGNGLPDPNHQKVGRIGLAISRSNPNIVFAHYTDGYHHMGIFKSSDGGDNWVDFDPDDAVNHAFSSGFSWYFSQVRVSPVDTNVVYAMEVQFVVTRDGGNTWAINPGNTQFHVDHHALAFDPTDPEHIVEGNDGGLNISNDGGRTWSKVRNLPVTQLYEVTVDPRFPDQLYAGSQDNQNIWSETGAADEWNTLDLGFGGGGDGFYIIVAYEEPSPGEIYRVVYAEAQNGDLYKSLEGSGEGFQSLKSFIDNASSGQPRNWSTPIAMDPRGTAVLYYGTNRILRSATRGTTWETISPQLTNAPGIGGYGTVTTIAVSPTSPDRLLVGTDDGNVWVTTNLGSTWIDISGGLPVRWVTRVAFDPQNADRLYVTFSGLKWNDPLSHVFRSDNLGESWNDVSDNLPDAPVNALAIDPVDPNIVYVGSDVGAFVSYERGGSWEILGNGLPSVAVYDLEVHDDPHFLLAGTYGRSIYRMDLTGISSPTATESQPLELPATISDVSNFPNPFRSWTTITFRLGRPTDLRAEVFDIAGRQIRVLHDGSLGAGSQELRWDGRDATGAEAANGVYLFRLTNGAGSVSETGRMVLAR